MNAHNASTMESLLYAAGMTAYAEDCDQILHRRPIDASERAPFDPDALPPTSFGE